MFCVGVLPAQDIISLRNGTYIENVTILHISDTEISYKQNDKATTIARNSVEAILYADGRYEAISIVNKVEKISQGEYNEVQTMSERGNNRFAMESNSKQRLKGIIFTSVGGGLIIIGTILLATCVQYTWYGEGYLSIGQIVSGSILAAGGIGLLVPGILFFIKKENPLQTSYSYSINGKPHTAHLGFSPHFGKNTIGGGLTLRF